MGEGGRQCMKGRIKNFLVALASINHYHMEWRREREEKKMSPAFYFEES
jgi:hypothetical protein